MVSMKVKLTGMVLLLSLSYLVSHTGRSYSKYCNTAPSSD